MTTNDPEEIRRDIERTRANLSQDVNALADEAKPGNVVKRQVEGVKEGVRDTAQGLKERVFGSDDDHYAPYGYATGPTVGDRAHQLGADARGAMQDARGAVQDAPRQVKQRTRGNPLAAGLIAFGVGALIGGLIPTSRREQQLAADLKDKAQPVVDQAQAVAKEAAQHLQPQAQQAVENVRTSATESVQTVTEEGRVQAQDVKDHTTTAAQGVKDHAQNATQEVRGVSQNENEQYGTGQPGSSSDYAQPTTEYADQSTGYPEADQEYTESVTDPAEGGEDPRPENRGV